MEGWTATSHHCLGSGLVLAPGWAQEVFGPPRVELSMPLFALELDSYKPRLQSCVPIPLLLHKLLLYLWKYPFDGLQLSYLSKLLGIDNVFQNILLSCCLLPWFWWCSGCPVLRSSHTDPKPEQEQDLLKFKVKVNPFKHITGKAEGSCVCSATLHHGSVW